MEVDIICLCIMIPINGLLAILPANVAKRKGKEFRTWYIYGFFLWIVAMLHAISLPEEKNINYNTNLNSNISNNNVVKKPEYKIVSSNSLEGNFDLNSPVEVLRYEILSKDNENIYFNISFRNLNQGVISAVILELQGFDSFNELIKVDGNDKFTCRIQDLNGQLGSSFKNMYPVLLPKKDIRKLDITVKEVSFNGGKFIYKNEANKIEVEVENIKDEDEIKALRKHTQDGICYAKECNNLWVCVCGRPNHENVKKCVRCGLDKEYVFTALSREKILEEIKEEKRIEEEEEKERVLREQELEEKQKEQQEKERKARKKHMIFGSVIAIGIIVGIVELVNINQYKKMPLSYFVREGNVRGIKKLINLGEDVNGVYESGEESLGETPLNIAIKEENIKVIKTLISFGADVNQKDEDGKVPLNLAVKVRNIQIVKELINCRLDINQKDINGQTAFDIANELEEIKIADMLVDNGSNGFKKENTKLIINDGIDRDYINDCFSNTKNNNIEIDSIAKVYYEKGKPTGKVDYYFETNEKTYMYTGEIKNNSFNGNGVLYSKFINSNGKFAKYYNGEFKDGIFNGKGAIYWPLYRTSGVEKMQIEANFENGNINREYKLFKEDGTEYENGTCYNGIKS